MAMCSSVASAPPTMAASIIPAPSISHPLPLGAFLGAQGRGPPTTRPPAAGVLRRDGKPRLRQGLLHRRNGQELESVAPPRLFDVDVARRVEAFDLGGDVDLQVGRVEERDRADA